MALLGLALLACLLAPAAAVGASPAVAPHADPLALLAVQQAQLTAADGSSSDYFGISVALSGDTALVGVPYKDDYSGMGAAYVFVRSGGTWSQQAKLTASDGAGHDFFGISVALSGDTALVGKPGGAAYVFTRSGTSWTQQAQLTAADGAAGDRFGGSVALSGDTAVVGAYWHEVGSNSSQGAAYVFTRSGTSWTQQAQLTAFDGASGDNFGYSVALSGETALVGATDWNPVGVSGGQGAAYVFVRSGTTWTQQAQLTAFDGAPGDNFGYSVAISGDTALVGPQFHSFGFNPHKGAAYVFVRSDGNWTQQAQLTAADGIPYDQFGYSVALSGDTALVGAPWQGGNGTPTDSHGAAYVFARSGTSWTQQAKLTAAGLPDSWLGYSVALSGETALAGAPHDVVHTYANYGSADVFLLDDMPPVTTAGLSSSQPANAAGWFHTSPVTVTLTADAGSGSGVPAGNTWYRLQGAASWTQYTTAFTVSTPGSTTYEFYSQNAASNNETPKTATVRIDTGIPTAAASKNVTVKHGKKASLAFTVRDPAPSCGAASVTIVVKLKKKTVKTITIANAATNKAQSCSFKVTLKKGSYTWSVKATDIAGNAGKASGTKKLIVK